VLATFRRQRATPRCAQQAPGPHSQAGSKLQPYSGLGVRQAYSVSLESFFIPRCGRSPWRIYNSLITTLTSLSGTSVVVANGTTLTAGVYTATSFSINTTSGLTLDAQGNPNAQFVIRTSNPNISGSGAINLINGATPDNVIILYTGTGNLNWSSSGNFSGILLGSTSGNVTFSSAGSTSTGRVVFPNSTVTFNTGGLFSAGGTPEPSTFGLVGLGLAMVAVKLRAARTKRREAEPAVGNDHLKPQLPGG